MAKVCRLRVVGRPFPPTGDLHYLAQLIHRQRYVSPEIVVVPRQFGGQPFAIDVLDYADPRMAALLHAHRENELVQAHDDRETVTLVIPVNEQRHAAAVEQVRRAASALVARGERVSIDTVAKEAGGQPGRFWGTLCTPL